MAGKKDASLLQAAAGIVDRLGAASRESFHQAVDTLAAQGVSKRRARRYIAEVYRQRRGAAIRGRKNA